MFVILSGELCECCKSYSTHTLSQNEQKPSSAYIHTRFTHATASSSFEHVRRPTKVEQTAALSDIPRDISAPVTSPWYFLESETILAMAPALRRRTRTLPSLFQQLLSAAATASRASHIQISRLVSRLRMRWAHGPE